MIKQIKYPELAAQLKELRGDFPVKDFAKKLGIELVTYYRYERGETPIKEGLLKLAEIVSFEIADDQRRAAESVTGSGWQGGEGDVYKRASQMLLDIFKSKSAAKYQRAIMSNLEAFSESIKAEDRIGHLEKQVAELTVIVQQQTRASTDRRQIPGTGPDGIERRSGEDRRKHHGINNNNHI